MSTENQVIIAEACGWIYDEYHSRSFWDNGKERLWDEKTLAWRYDSLDSMQQAVLAQDEEFQGQFAFNLGKRVEWYSPEPPHLMHVAAIHKGTVADWQESFVETLRQLRRL